MTWPNEIDSPDLLVDKDRTQTPFGFYDHFNDVLYRGPMAWVEAEKAIIGGNSVTAVFDLSSADSLLAKRVAEIDQLREENIAFRQALADIANCLPSQCHASWCQKTAREALDKFGEPGLPYVKPPMP